MSKFKRSELSPEKRLVWRCTCSLGKIRTESFFPTNSHPGDSKAKVQRPESLVETWAELVLSNRTFCNDGNVLHLCCPVGVAIGHMWPPLHMTSATEEFK